MTSLQQISHLSCQILHSGVRWLIYVRLLPGEGVVEIGATDGALKMYRQSFTWEKFKTAFGAGNKLSDDQIVLKVREALQKSQLQLVIVGVKLKVELNRIADFELYEVSSSDIKSEIASLLFNFAQKCMDYRNELQLLRGQTSTGASAGNSANSDVSPNKSPRKRQTRDFAKTSAINPGTKIRKKATGFNYDDD